MTVLPVFRKTTCFCVKLGSQIFQNIRPCKIPLFRRIYSVIKLNLLRSWMTMFHANTYLYWYVFVSVRVFMVVLLHTSFYFDAVVSWAYKLNFVVAASCEQTSYSILGHRLLWHQTESFQILYAYEVSATRNFGFGRIRYLLAICRHSTSLCSNW